MQYQFKILHQIFVTGFKILKGTSMRQVMFSALQKMYLLYGCIKPLHERLVELPKLVGSSSYLPLVNVWCHTFYISSWTQLDFMTRLYSLQGLWQCRDNWWNTMSHQQRTVHADWVHDRGSWLLRNDQSESSGRHSRYCHSGEFEYRSHSSSCTRGIGRGMA